MITVPPSADWIEVKSAFGGFAIYRKDCLLDAKVRYVAVDSQGNGICEHIPFHDAIRSNGHKIFINPKLINARYTEHTRQLVGWEQMVDITKSLIQIFKGTASNVFHRNY
jgi:hypothetical protein